MNGIYIHIPYCRQVCYYCDFHFRVAMRDKAAMLAAMKQEMEYRRNYLRLNGETGRVAADTLYFGGGTPSVLSVGELGMLMREIERHYRLLPDAEITLEANPDDLTDDYLSGLRDLGINRLSVGVQSFHDDDLRRLNRRHTAREAYHSVERAQRKGFGNISIDLMYGLPAMSSDRWRYCLHTAFSLDVPHLSAYHLTVEPRTVFGKRQNKGENFHIAEEDSAAQFDLLADACEAAGYEHYEISNFARTGFQARHNTAYWRQQPYIGIGPSAHSYNGTSRQWNVNNNTRYIELLTDTPKDEQWCEREILSPFDAYNDYILTALRTSRGVRKDEVRQQFGDAFADGFVQQAVKHLRQACIVEHNGSYTLTRKGKFIADGIISDLMMTDDDG